MSYMCFYKYAAYVCIYGRPLRSTILQSQIQNIKSIHSKSMEVRWLISHNSMHKKNKYWVCTAEYHRANALEK